MCGTGWWPLGWDCATLLGYVDTLPWCQPLHSCTFHPRPALINQHVKLCMYCVLSTNHSRIKPVPSVWDWTVKCWSTLYIYAFYLVFYMCVYLWILPLRRSYIPSRTPPVELLERVAYRSPAVTVVFGQLASVLVCWCSHLGHMNNDNNTHTYWITINWPYITWTYTYRCQCLFIVGLSTTASVRRHSWSDVSPDTILLCFYMDIPWIASKHQMNSHKYI